MAGLMDPRHVQLWLKRLEEPNGKALDDIRSGLQAMADTQWFVSGLVPGAIPERGKLTTDQVRTYCFALIVEVAEFAQELNWKPWKLMREHDPKKVAEEFADIIAFFGVLLNFMQSMDISMDAVARAYAAKSMVNMERFLGQREGYGVGKEGI